MRLPGQLHAVSSWEDAGELLPERHVLGGRIGLACQEAPGPPGTPWITRSTVDAHGRPHHLPFRLPPRLQLLWAGGVRRDGSWEDGRELLPERYVLGGRISLGSPPNLGR